MTFSDKNSRDNTVSRSPTIICLLVKHALPTAM